MRLSSPASAVIPPLPAQAVAAPSARARSPHTRPVVWVCSFALLLALLVLTPPLVNANRYRTRIAETMSMSLGRPVHLDNVSLHLLPMPGFTLQNLVVSEDPDFGAEPTIRANTVEATLRVSSLWRRPVEFSSVRFVEPSVNLARNAQGRWNISEVLLHASRVDSAPTTQGRAGPAPRFPYIEATGGRVNVKLGVEKLPFSLTDTDFALWLPSARQWRVRLVGHPVRTDTDITDPGTVRVEGDLQRAGSLPAVPVDFHASWHDAPLGEATRIVAGTDLGWRGSLNVDATLKGTLGDARLEAKTTLGSLRRAEFFPAHPLDVQIVCRSAFALHPATLHHLQCTAPDDGPTPLSLTADTVHLQALGATTATLRGDLIPARWGLLWMGLFSPRVPAGSRFPGTLHVDISRSPEPDLAARAPLIPRRAIGPPTAGTSTASAGSGQWSGLVRLDLPKPGKPGSRESNSANMLLWQVTDPTPPEVWPHLRLPPTPVSLGEETSLTLAGEIGGSGYSLDVRGSAPVTLLRAPTQALPQLGDGLDTVLPANSATVASVPVWFRCSRPWTAPQTCSTEVPLAPAARERTPSRPRKRRH